MLQQRGTLELLLLAALADSPAHGYVLIERLRERSHGVLDFPEGSIYPALHKLEAEGLVRSRWADVGRRRRRIYSLSGPGRSALQRRTAEWERFTGAVSAVLA